MLDHSKRLDAWWRRRLLHPAYIRFWSILTICVFCGCLALLIVGWLYQWPTEVMIVLAVSGCLGLIAGVGGNVVVIKNSKGFQQELEQED